MPRVPTPEEFCRRLTDRDILQLVMAWNSVPAMEELTRRGIVYVVREVGA